MKEFELSTDLILEKLKSKTHFDSEFGHWLYQGAISTKGYGNVRIGEYSYQVHRLSAAIYLELDINDVTKLALHKILCQYKNCWNPDHLYVGNNSDNQQDSVILGTHKSHNRDKMICINGHPLIGDNVYIPKDGRRRCKICRQNNTKKQSENNKKTKVLNGEEKC